MFCHVAFVAIHITKLFIMSACNVTLLAIAPSLSQAVGISIYLFNKFIAACQLADYLFLYGV